MKLRLPLSCALLATFTALTAAQQPASPLLTAKRERMRGSATPGVLLPLRTARGERLIPSVGNSAVQLPAQWATDPSTGAQYRPGQLLVRFRDGATPEVRDQVRRLGRGARVVRTLPGNWELIDVEPGVTASDALRTMAGHSAVEQAALNYRVTVHQMRPNDESYGLQWNFDAINLPYAWQINPGAANDVIVAVVDTGLNIINDTLVFDSPFVGQVALRFAAVPDLVTDARIANPYDFVYDDEFPVDLGGHGTHVAGTVAQQTNNSIGVAGVAYNVRLMPLKVISGGSFDAWDELLAPGNPGGTGAVVAEAIRYAADNGARVINLSLGGEGPQPVIRDAITDAVGRGAFVAISAGNAGDLGNPTEYPAAYAAQINGAMAVGSVNRSLRRAAYSSFHSYVEICAPGGETNDDFDFAGGITQVGYEEDATLSFLSFGEKFEALRLGFRPRFDLFELRPFQGTSMSAPHVSGVAALLYSQGIRNPAAIEAAIKRFATPIQARPDECGAGLIDARRALRGLGLAR